MVKANTKAKNSVHKLIVVAPLNLTWSNVKFGLAFSALGIYWTFTWPLVVFTEVVRVAVLVLPWNKHTSASLKCAKDERNFYSIGLSRR